jgi:hypothetical protein
MRNSSKDAKKQAMADIAYVQGILRIWDPIGIFPGDVGPMDEYDSYAPQLVTLLRGGATVDKIQDRLGEIRTRSMGLPAYPQKDRLIADQLVSWWGKRPATASVKITSPELQKLIAVVRGCLIEQPTDLIRLNLSLENLLYFLTTPTGRTKDNCAETDLYFSLHAANGFDWEHLPESYRLILDDLSGQLHDAIDSPAIAANFDSTPEQLLDRILKLKTK